MDILRRLFARLSDEQVDEVALKTWFIVVGAAIALVIFSEYLTIP